MRRARTRELVVYLEEFHGNTTFFGQYSASLNADLPSLYRSLKVQPLSKPNHRQSLLLLLKLLR